MNKTIEKQIADYKAGKRVGEMLSKNLADVQDTFKMSVEETDQVFLSADESFEDYKKKYEESTDIVIPEVECIGSDIITSAMLMSYTEHAKYLTNIEFDVDLVNSFKDAVSENQIVVAVGPNCRQVKVGDLVKVRLTDFVRVKNPNSVNRAEVNEVPILELNGKVYLTMHETNLQFIYKTEQYYKIREDATIST